MSVPEKIGIELHDTPAGSGVARGVRGCCPHRAALARGGKRAKNCFKKTYTHANSDYLFLLAYEEQKKIAIANTSRVSVM